MVGKKGGVSIFQGNDTKKFLFFCGQVLSLFFPVVMFFVDEKVSIFTSQSFPVLFKKDLIFPPLSSIYYLSSSYLTGSERYLFRAATEICT